ncbi:hypothetical protein [Actinophytocola sp.]|jgi:hypothetical protein|uniref:hypothetical protein n=1 Tax=Actinophytocola sp. TaxID=1872138 RepID=UPI002ED89621
MAKRSGVVLGAAVLALVVANNGGGRTAAPGGGTGPAAALGLSASQAAAQRGDLAAASRAMGMLAGPGGRRHDTDCAANAFGQVRAYLARTPCRSLDRLLFTIRDSRGGTIAVAVAWVDFPTAAQAREFRRIDDIWGTGQISPLPGATAGIPNVRLSGQHYRSRREGTLAVVAEAEPVTGQQTDALLDQLAGVAVLLPYVAPPSGK